MITILKYIFFKYDALNLTSLLHFLLVDHLYREELGWISKKSCLIDLRESTFAAQTNEIKLLLRNMKLILW